MVYVSSQTNRKQYSFPSVSINEQVLSPAPQNSLWRSTIGVAAAFNKGPLKAQISSQQDLIDIFGDDASPGSIFMNQAMSQGATNFIVSRVVPSALAAKGLIHLGHSSNPNSIEANVSTDSTNYTNGLTLTFRGVNKNVQPINGAFLGYETNTNGEYKPVQVEAKETVSGLTDAKGIQGLGSLEFTVLEKVKEAQFVDDLGNYIVKFSQDYSLEYIGKDVIKITLLNSNTAADIVTNKRIKVGHTLEVTLAGAETREFTVLTPLHSYYNDNKNLIYEFYVKSVNNAADEVPAGAEFTIKGAPTDYFILGYKYSGTDSSILAGALPIQPYAEYGSYNGFITVAKTNVGTTDYPINTVILPNVTDKTVSALGTTGVAISFGSETAQSIELSANSSTVFSVNALNVSVNVTDITPGTNALTILKRLRDQLLVSQMSSLLGEVTVNESNLPYSLSFNLGTVGEAGNYIHYTLTRSVIKPAPEDPDPTDLAFNVNSEDQFGKKIFMVGGRDGNRRANLTLYDNKSEPVVYVEAITEGVSGHNIKLNVTPLDEGKFDLAIYYENNSYANEEKYSSIPEVFTLSNKSVDLNTGIYPESLDSQYVRVFFIPVVNNLRLGTPKLLEESFFSAVPTRVAPINYDLVGLDNLDKVNEIGHPNHRGKEYLQNLSLNNGKENPYDVNNPDEIDVIAAINRLKTEDIAFLTSPHIIVGDNKYEAALNTLIEQLDNSSPYNGLRFGVVQAQRNLSLSKANVLFKKYDNKRLVILNGHSSLREKYYLGLNTNASVGYYTGLMAVTPPHISPVAAGTVQNIYSTDTNNDLDYLDKITQARIECLYLDPVVKTVKFLNGRTTASNLDDKWLSVNRISDYLVMGLFRNLQWARSQPNNSSLRNRVASACDAFLATTKLAGWIQDYSPTICNESNNSAQDIVRGKLNVVISYIPVFPADYINVNLIRTFSNEFSLDLNV